MRLPSEIEDAFQSGATILTANVRAARFLEREYAQAQRRAGRSFWATPPIHDWDGWLRRLWQADSVGDADAPLLLASLQERSVWTRMLREDARLLVSPESMAAMAEEAYALLCAYEAHAERNRIWSKPDAERFRHWAAEFDRECTRHRWMSRGRLERWAAEAVQDDVLLLPAEIVLVGFERMTPAQKTIVTTIEARGVAVRIAKENEPEERPELVRAVDARDEIAACAWWTRTLLEENEEIRIGVLAPDLHGIRSEIERVFRRVLMPETDDVFASTTTMPFELSLGQPLGNVPVIRAALLLLRWLSGPLREEEISWLLLSGFLSASEGEYLALARFDAEMRDSGSLSMEVSLSSVLRRLNSVRWPLLESLRLRLNEMRMTVTRNRVMAEKRLPSQCVEITEVLLKQGGWPRAQKADVVEFQALAKWEQLLEEIALLDFDGQRMGYEEFLHRVEQRAGEVIFSPESQGAPVQIMGAMEAAGQHFDAVWFLGADDQSWPLRGRMHPLLPGEIQQHAGMPYANEELDWKLAQSVTRRIVASAATAVVSFAQRDKDGELRPSPLLTQVAPDAPGRESRRTIADLSREGVTRGTKLEEIRDDSGSIAWDRDRTAGGTDVLKRQAACPFQAFATRRLGANELNRSEWGLSAAERGKLLHEVLEAIWSPEYGQLHTLKDLLDAIREKQLRELVDSAIGKVFDQFVRKHALDLREDQWMDAYLKSEQRRLRTRLEEWLELEARRAPFAVVATEKKLNDVSVAGLKLNLRADRIDETAEGKHLLLDYKSGKVKPADWKTMRPKDPQLPLYAAFGNVEDLCGALFARIRVGETEFSGVVRDAQKDLFPDIGRTAALVKEPYTDAMRDEWTAALMNLAGDFLRGEAAVDPRDGRKTCEFCPLPGLCRIAENRGALDEDAEEDAKNGDE